MRFFYTLLLLTLFTSVSSGQTLLVDFEDKTLSGPNTAYYGQDFAGGFTSRGTFFNNNFTDFGGGFTGWEGFAYSNVINTTTAGLGNQYAAYNLDALHPGGDHSPLYGIANSFNYQGTQVTDSFARITLPAGTRPLTMSVTNTTYAALSMLNGDGFGKKFGGASGDDPDWFLLRIQGRDAVNAMTGVVEFYLADYRTSVKTIISEWTPVDLSSLTANTTSLTFELTSSDVGSFGMNTPSYFALDNLLVAVPEPGTVVLVALAGAGGPACIAWRRWRRRSPARFARAS